MGPLMPVPLRHAKCTRFDGPPRVVALGFQLNNGHLEGPNDLFDDPAFDYTRMLAQTVTDYIGDTVHLNHTDYPWRKWSIQHYHRY